MPTNVSIAAPYNVETSKLHFNGHDETGQALFTGHDRITRVLPDWVPEIETKPAPGDLLLLQAFVNTFEADTGIDVLTECAEANAWLHQSGLVTTAVELDGTGLIRLRAVREAFRMLLVQNAGLGNPGHAEIDLLNESLGDSAIVLSVDPEDQHSVQAVPTGTDLVGMATARLLLIVRDAQRDGTWSRLKACSRSECRWAYYDRSHSQRGRWCDMATCGNRVKNQALRLRRQN